MNTALAVNPRKYARLLTRSLPSPIETEKEYEARLAEVEQLMAKDKKAPLTAEEETLLDLLTTLIEQYEEDHYPIGPASPHDMLDHLMEAHDLTHKDVWQLFGSRGVASEVLNRKRAISKAQAKRLAEFFHISPALFI